MGAGHQRIIKDHLERADSLGELKKEKRIQIESLYILTV